MFITETLPEEQQALLDKHNEDLRKVITGLNSPLFLIKLAVILSIFISIGRFIAEIVAHTYGISVGEIWVLQMVLTAVMLIAVGIIICGYIRSKRILDGGSAIALDEQGKLLERDCHEALGIPLDAENVEFFAVDYAVENGKVELLESLGSGSINTEYKVYVWNNKLCMADISEKHSVPLENTVGIKRIDDRISFMFWYKDTPYNKDEYKQYNIKFDKKEQEYTVKWYYSLQIQYNGEDYELYFPPYELSVIEKLTGFKAE